MLLTIFEELDSEFEEEKKGLIRGEFLFKVCLSFILCNLLFLQPHTQSDSVSAISRIFFKDG